jgi:hypothetical protein
MKHLIVTTAHGDLYTVGRIHANRRQPVLFAMGGAWTPDDFLHELVDWFPGVSVVVAPFPGMGDSRTTTFDVTILARMVDELLDCMFSGVPVVTYGLSTGCLVTLGLRAPQIVRHVAMEPFFRTSPLWPLHIAIRDMIAAAPERVGGAQAAEALFWYTAPPAERILDRDYRHVIDGLFTPVDVIVGDIPLEPVREIDGWPSFTSAADREMLAAHPHVTLRQGPAGTGHWLDRTPDGVAVIRRLLHQSLLAAAKSWKWPDAD